MTLEQLGLVGVKQTILGRGPTHNEPWGNCMQAALATALSMPLENVPHFLEHNDWWADCNRWLARHGMQLLHFNCAADWPLPPAVSLLIGRTVRDSEHVVVGFGNQMIFDPHPSNAGLTEVIGVEVFVSIKPHLVGVP